MPTETQKTRLVVFLVALSGVSTAHAFDVNHAAVAPSASVEPTATTRRTPEDPPPLWEEVDQEDDEGPDISPNPTATAQRPTRTPRRTAKRDHVPALRHALNPIMLPTCSSLISR